MTATFYSAQQNLQAGFEHLNLDLSTRHALYQEIYLSAFLYTTFWLSHFGTLPTGLRLDDQSMPFNI